MADEARFLAIEAEDAQAVQEHLAGLKDGACPACGAAGLRRGVALKASNEGQLTLLAWPIHALWRRCDACGHAHEHTLRTPLPAGVVVDDPEAERRAAREADERAREAAAREALAGRDRAWRAMEARAAGASDTACPWCATSTLEVRFEWPRALAALVAERSPERHVLFAVARCSSCGGRARHAFDAGGATVTLSPEAASPEVRVHPAVEGWKFGTFERGLRVEGKPGASQVAGRPSRGLHAQRRGLSLEHCQVALWGDGVDLVDLGSAGGTAVNGRRARRLFAAAGDEVCLGPVRFQVNSPFTPVRLQETAGPRSVPPADDGPAPEDTWRRFELPVGSSRLLGADGPDVELVLPILGDGPLAVRVSARGDEVQVGSRQRGDDGTPRALVAPDGKRWLTVSAGHGGRLMFDGFVYDVQRAGDRFVLTALEPAEGEALPGRRLGLALSPADEARWRARALSQAVADGVCPACHDEGFGGRVELTGELPDGLVHEVRGRCPACGHADRALVLGPAPPPARLDQDV